jgi:hypothetical protein
VRTAAEAAEQIERLTGLKRGPTQIRQFLKTELGFRWRRNRVIPCPPQKDLPDHIREQKQFLDTQLRPRLNEAAADYDAIRQELLQRWRIAGYYFSQFRALRVWSGRHLKAGQVRLYKPGQAADHVTAADHYQLVALALDADLVQKEVPVLGGIDPDNRLAGMEVVTTSPACCRDLWSYLVGLLDMAQAQPGRLAQSGQWMEQESLRRFTELMARSNDDRAACQPSNRARVVRRAEDYMQAHLRNPPFCAQPLSGTRCERAHPALCVPGGPWPESDGLFQDKSTQ